MSRGLRSKIAYHEAGHAVVGLALKLPVAFVTIRTKHDCGSVSLAPNNYGVGTVRQRGSDRLLADLSKVDAFGNPVAPEPNRDPHAGIVMSLAGGMAEAEFVQKGEWRDYCSRGDIECIRFDLRELGRDGRGIDEYAGECEVLVKKHWGKIELVARKLLKEQTLSGVEVYDICFRHAQNMVRRRLRASEIPRRMTLAAFLIGALGDG
jgi:hypothetical protein